MKKSKWSESQILKILKEYESGVSVKQLARTYGFYYQSLYLWKRKYGGIESSSELVKYRELEKENNRLKKMYAEVSMERDALKDVLSKKW